MTTRSTEISLQQHLHPQLNHPWINPLLRRHGLQRPQYSIPATRTGPIGITRLHRHHRRLERQHSQECLLDLHLLRASDVLHLLHRLGSDTNEKFYTSQVLRSHAASPDILYLLRFQHFHTDGTTTQFLRSTTLTCCCWCGHPGPRLCLNVLDRIFDFPTEYITTSFSFHD